MKKNLLLLIFVFAFSVGYAQSPLWTKASAGSLNALEKADRSTMPKEYQIYKLDVSRLKTQLQAAPSRENMGTSNVVIAFPNAEGTFENYRIYQSSVMEKELAARHSEIQSYVGQGIDNPNATIHFSTTIFGVHAMIMSDKGTKYIDPYTKDLNNYIVYNRSSVSSTRSFECGTTEDALEGRGHEFSNAAFANDGTFRTYRLAMACTIEYAAFHVNAAVAAGTLSPTATLAQKKAAVLAAMAITVTRVNSVFERDMSLKLVLVATNENVIFVDADSFTNNPPVMINEMQAIVDANIGAANYDIGHGVCTSDNGIAQLGSVCGTNKARGVTGQPNPVGDQFDIDYVIHEMGHQFGATHTQNNDCNRTAATAVEPGSASTIMGYAGICAPDVQNNSDAYFHTVSLTQMFSFVTTGGTCSVNVPNNNAAPVIPVLTNYTIPAGTPFVLRGSATDADGDALTYCWEQTNAGSTTDVPNATSTANPNFRSLSPTTSPNRYFPSLLNTYGTWEVLPTVAKTMSFALTVRDNRTPNGGQTARRNMTVTTSTASAPFTVTSQNVDGVSWTQGQTQTITWNVGATTAAPFNTANVNILLSTDGGQTYSTLLANTPNDGSEAITVPNTAAPFCRIMVEAVGNIYYALNARPFAIGYTIENVCTTYTNSTVVAIPDGPNPNVSTPGPTLTSTINIPDTGNITDVNVRVNVTHQWIRDLISTVRHPDGTLVALGSRICNDQDGYNILFNDGSPNIVCAAPITSGTFRPTGALSTLNGKAMAGDWQLLINDYFQGDTGNLNLWSIEVCRQTAVLNTPNFGLKDFKIYPNPNNGTFNIQFDSDSSNEIKVGVHDMRGRQIFEKSYQNSGLFSQSLELNNTQAGIYLVTVQDGDKKEVKKIVIE